jgi:Cu+-exporting ATPase
MVGNRRLMEREGVALNGVGERAAELEAAARTTMWVAVGDVAIGDIAVGDIAAGNIAAGNGAVGVGSSTVLMAEDAAILAAIQPHSATPNSSLEAVALIGVADTIKDGSAAAVAALRGMGLTVVMLTGDNEATAAAMPRGGQCVLRRCRARSRVM